MNDALLGTSGKKVQDIKGSRAKSSTFSVDEDNEERSPSTYAKGYKLLQTETKGKQKILINKIRFIFLLNFIPFLGIIYSFLDVHWYLMASTNISYYWTNLLLIEKETGTNQTIYETIMFTFIKNDCQYENLTQNDPPQLCQVLQSYFYSGLIASGVIIFGLFFHGIHILQLARLGCRRNADMEGLRFNYFILFCYSSSFVYWIFGSASFINSNNSEVPFQQKIGYSIIVYLSAIGFFILLTIWFERLIKTSSNQKMVNELLNAGNKYVSKL